MRFNRILEGNQIVPNLFDENGYLLPPAPVTEAEKAMITAFANAVYTPSADRDGLALSQLRPPKSNMSLQRAEKIVNALVSDGVLRSVIVQGGKGYWIVYHVVGGV